MRFLLLMMAVSWFASPAAAALVESVVKVPVEVTDVHQRKHQHDITVTIFRDDARDRAPFLILNHGRAADAAGRAKLGRARYDRNAAYFVERGFAVFVPTRIGYGVTGGPDIEDSGPCNGKHYTVAFDIAAAENLPVIQYAKSRSYVIGDRGILVGQSVGGATTVALAARNIAGVAGAINFAGGAGGSPATRPDQPCAPDTLARTYADFGRTARISMLWLYSENDRFWGKDFPHKWFEGYTAQGAVAEFVQLPPSGTNGHSSFTDNPSAWRPHVERYLKSLGY